MIDSTWMEVVWVVFTAMTGMIAIGAGVIGYWIRGMHWLERFPAIIIGLLLIYPETITDIIGLASFAVLLAFQYFKKQDKRNMPTILDNNHNI